MAAVGSLEDCCSVENFCSQSNGLFNYAHQELLIHQKDFKTLIISFSTARGHTDTIHLPARIDGCCFDEAREPPVQVTSRSTKVGFR